MYNFKPSDLFDHLAKNIPSILIIQSIFILVIILIYNFLSFNQNHLKQKEIKFQVRINYHFLKDNPTAVKDLYSEVNFNEAVSELGLDMQNYSDFYKNLYIRNAKNDILDLTNTIIVDNVFNSYFGPGKSVDKNKFYEELIKQITNIKPTIYDITFNIDKNNYFTINQVISLFDLMNKKINKRSELLSQNFENIKALDMQVNIITIASKILFLNEVINEYHANNFLKKYFEENLRLIEIRFNRIIQSDLKQHIVHQQQIKNTIIPIPYNDNLNNIHEDLIVLDGQTKKLFSHYEIKSNHKQIIDIISPIEYNDFVSLINYKKIKDIVILSFNFLLLVIMYFIFAFFRKKPD